MLLAEVAAGDEEWAEMSLQYTAAETARGADANAASAIQAHVSKLLNEKKDPAAALPVIARYRGVAKPEDTTADFYEGEARRQLGQCAEAVAAYERVLAKNPDARNTRFGIAECQEKLGNRAEARKHYEQFARQFPKDERASRARDSAKRLN
jgi:tetratricopeptide (TPR) repeat protein